MSKGLVVMLLGCVLAGCSSGGNKSMMSSQKAWSTVESERDTGGVLDVIFGGTTGRQTNLEGMSDKHWESAERAIDSDVPTEAMDQMIDELSQQIAVDLPSTPEIKDSPHQMVLNIGDFRPNQDRLLNAIMSGIESRLRANSAINESFLVIALADEELLKKVSGDSADFEDPSQRGGSAGIVKYDPRYVYSLTARSFNRLNNKEEHSMRLMLDLEFIQPREQRKINTFSFDKTYFWQPYAKKWISQDEEQARRRAEEQKK